MNAMQSHTTVEFASREGLRNVFIRWTMPDQIYVSLRLEHTQPPLYAERTWKPNQLCAGNAERAITGVPLQGAQGPGNFQLSVSIPGQTSARIEWSPHGEPEPLNELRHLLYETAHVACLEALMLLDWGRKLTHVADYDGALQAFRRGIRVMGDRYLNPNLVDDSGMKLVLANSQEQSGNLSRAAALMERVLESRVMEYLQFHGL